MQQLVRVVKCGADGTARVLHLRQSACSGDCHQCAGCGAQQETLIFDAQNPIGATVGDVVYVSASSSSVLAAAAIMYMLPLLLFFLGYALGELLHQAVLTGCLAFALGICLAVLYDRLVVKRRETIYTITGYGPDQKRGYDLD